MHAGADGYARTFAGALFAALFAVSLSTWTDVIRDEPTDDMIPPWCRSGSLESWEGRPCLFPLRTGSVERAGIGERIG